MKGHQLSFFATIADIHSLSTSLRRDAVKFVERDVPADLNPIVLSAISELQPLKTYLVLPADKEVVVSRIEMKDGRTRLEADVEPNPGSALLHLGGLIEPTKLLAGQYGAGRNDPESVTTFKLVSEAIRRRFEKIKSYYVGSEAAKLLDGGGRLSPTEKSPIIYDLVR